MKLVQYYLDCLSQASYLIGDETTGRAVVVDPRRDVAEYLADAKAAGLTIELVIETHFHADFLSGHLELAAATGAKIAYSDVATTEFESRKLAHGERISLGDVNLEIRHTPGHTPESISIVVREHADAVPHAVLTGDTLFVGDVGRPDLLSSVGVSEDELAAMLYTSVHEQLLTLPDDTRVYPGHGAGSSCGKNLSAETSSTIGEQRRTNVALLAESREAFIDLVTEGQPPAPNYFSHDAALNRLERPLLDEHRLPTPLSLAEVDQLVADGATLLDGRDPERFAEGHLTGSVNVGLNGRYAEFSGSIVPLGARIVVVADDGDELEAKNRLARIGFDQVEGFLASPARTLATNPDRVRTAARMTAAEFAKLDHAEVQLVDIRNPGETALGTIPGARTIPLGQLRNRLGELDPTRPTVVFCAGGYRSSAAASLLRSVGFETTSDIIGGYTAWTLKDAGV
jgi:glyoxylase-like metal-dependent hydrolase (beta-lactamase superfamily II)/rhodanese-related sulfurtransferase